MYSDIVIRHCKKDDNFMAISKLYLKVWQIAYKDILPKSFLEQMSIETWKPQKRWKNTIIAKKEDKIIGVCSFGKIRNNNNCHLGEIYTLYIDPEKQKLGIGKEIINKAIKDLRKNNYEKILLWVIYNNYSAINFYKKMGFVPNGKTTIDKSKYGTFKQIAMIKVFGD